MIHHRRRVDRSPSSNPQKAAFAQRSRSVRAGGAARIMDRKTLVGPALALQAPALKLPCECLS